MCMYLASFPGLPQGEGRPGTHCLRMRWIFPTFQEFRTTLGYLRVVIRHSRYSRIISRFRDGTSEFYAVSVHTPTIFHDVRIHKIHACANSVYQAFPLLAEGQGTRLARTCCSINIHIFSLFLFLFVSSSSFSFALASFCSSFFLGQFCGALILPPPLTLSVWDHYSFVVVRKVVQWFSLFVATWDSFIRYYLRRERE